MTTPAKNYVEVISKYPNLFENPFNKTGNEITFVRYVDDNLKASINNLKALKRADKLTPEVFRQYLSVIKMLLIERISIMIDINDDSIQKFKVISNLLDSFEMEYSYIPDYIPRLTINDFKKLDEDMF